MKYEYFSNERFTVFVIVFFYEPYRFSCGLNWPAAFEKKYTVH